MLRFTTFPRTSAPEQFVYKVIDAFQEQYLKISTIDLEKGLQSDEVLALLNPSLEEIGFQMETSKARKDKVFRPVLFGENGKEILKYEIDGFHEEWKCGIEVEAGRAIMGNAVYRDIVQSLVMVNLEHLILAVPNSYKYFSNKRLMTSRDYDKTLTLVDTIYSHDRIVMPYRLTLIGY